MGYWFGKSDRCKPWRRTPTKIGNTWYTPYGERIRNPKAYFRKVRENGRYWEGNTGWNDPSPCDLDYDDDDYDDDCDFDPDLAYDFDEYDDEPCGYFPSDDYDPDLDDLEYQQDSYLGC